MWLFGEKKEVSKVVFDDLSVNARLSLKGFPYKRVRELESADIVWLRSGFGKVAPYLSENQLINFLPNEFCITDKGNLMTYLYLHDQKKEGQLRRENFYPDSYRFYIESDREALLERLPKANLDNQPWILKPTDLSSGMGMMVLNDYDEIRELLKNPLQNYFDPERSKERRYLLQKYIKNVLLLNDRKSEIRIYFLIASVDPLMVLMLNEGTVRLNTMPFKMDEFDNPLIHITNIYQQENNAHYDPSLALKWDFAAFDQEITTRMGLKYSYVKDFFMPRIKEIIRFIVMASREDLFKGLGKGMHFSLMGADVIIDDQLNPWLTEVQHGPGLDFQGKIKKRLIPQMMKDTFRIMLDLQKRKRKGQALEIEDTGAFEWVINEANQ